MVDYGERCYWNMRTYGKAFRVNKWYMRTFVLLICMATPGTNWLIPILWGKMRQDKMLRYTDRPWKEVTWT